MIGGCQFGYFGDMGIQVQRGPLYMAQMAYVEVALGVSMDWSTVSTSLQAQQKSNLYHKIPWLIKTQPNPVPGFSKMSKSKG
jgi:hypothetical protein